MPKNTLKKTSGVVEIQVYIPDPPPVNIAQTPYPTTQNLFSLGGMGLEYNEESQVYTHGGVQIAPEAIHGYLMSTIYAQNEMNVNELLILGGGYLYQVNLTSGIPKAQSGISQLEVGSSMTTQPVKTQPISNTQQYSFSDPLAALKMLYPNVSEEILRRSTAGSITRMPSTTYGASPVSYGAPPVSYGPAPVQRLQPTGGGVNVAEQNQALYNSVWSGFSNYSFP